jgi:hypothetical protein
MAGPTEIVQVLKVEPANPGDDFGTPDSIDSTEDVIQVAGVAFGRLGQDASDLACLDYRDPVTDKRSFCDVDFPLGVSLFDLANGALPPATRPGQLLFSCDGLAFAPEDPITSPVGWLANDGGDLLVGGF